MTLGLSGFILLLPGPTTDDVTGLPALANLLDANGSAVAGLRSSGRLGPLAGLIGAEESPADAVDDEWECLTLGEKALCADPGRDGRLLAAAASRFRAAMVSFSVERPGPAAVVLREKRALLLVLGPTDC